MKFRISDFVKLLGLLFFLTLNFYSSSYASNPAKEKVNENSQGAKGFTATSVDTNCLSEELKNDIVSYKRWAMDYNKRIYEDQLRISLAIAIFIGFLLISNVVLLGYYIFRDLTGKNTPKQMVRVKLLGVEIETQTSTILFLSLMFFVLLSYLFIKNVYPIFTDTSLTKFINTPCGGRIID